MFRCLFCFTITANSFVQLEYIIGQYIYIYIYIYAFIIIQVEGICIVSQNGYINCFSNSYLFLLWFLYNFFSYARFLQIIIYFLACNCLIYFSLHFIQFSYFQTLPLFKYLIFSKFSIISFILNLLSYIIRFLTF